jgi:hypothetical protein
MNEHFAPAACSVRAISAPTRRAPPVIRTTWSRREEFSILGVMRENDTAMAAQGELMLNERCQARHCAQCARILAAQIARRAAG